MWVVGCKEKVSYLCGRIMSVKTCSSMHASIGCELLPPSRRLYGTSSARLTAEEVVLLPKKKTQKHNVFINTMHCIITKGMTRNKRRPFNCLLLLFNE